MKNLREGDKEYSAALAGVEEDYKRILLYSADQPRDLPVKDSQSDTDSETQTEGTEHDS